MSRGSYLSCERYRPGHRGRVAAGKHAGLILDYWPYPDAPDAYWTKTRATYYARHGYDVLVCAIAGTSNGVTSSPGFFSTWFQPSETRDNYDLIEWLAAQPNSNGKIAQEGWSYGSITAQRVAALRPPHLVAIVPIFSPTNIYNWVYPGGIPSSNMDWQASSDAAPASNASILAHFQDNPLYDAYWKQVATGPKLGSIDVPILYYGGYSDVFRAGGWQILQQRPDKTWLVYGPWTHLDPPEAPGLTPAQLAKAWGGRGLSEGAMLEFLDHWTLGLKSAKLPPTAVTSYRSNSTGQEGRWYSYVGMPAADNAARRLYPTAQGSLSTTTPARSVLQYSVYPFDGPSGEWVMPWDPSVDQTTGGGNRATFTLPAFTSHTALTGPVTLHLRASITTPDTNFVAKLEVVTTHGTTEPIETGYLRAQLRNSLSKVTPVPRGRPVDYTIDLGEVNWKFLAGERLRITISGGDAPLIIPNAAAGLVSIDLGPETYVAYHTR